MIEQDGGVDFEARQQKADLKIRGQSDIVRRQNGSAKEHPEEQQLLNEMRQNRAALALNRALYDYDNDGSPPPVGDGLYEDREAPLIQFGPKLRVGAWQLRREHKSDRGHLS